MQFVWQKGRASWIASHPARETQAHDLFPFSDAPENSAIIRLSQQLLGYGGEAVVVLFIEEGSCAFFVEKGEISSYNSIRLQVGEQSECHANSARLWRSQPDKFCLITGYALSEDQMWRRHSWIIDNTEHLIETTTERVKYFGVRLSEPQAASFSHVYLETA